MKRQISRILKPPEQNIEFCLFSSQDLWFLWTKSDVTRRQQVSTCLFCLRVSLILSVTSSQDRALAFRFLSPSAVAYGYCRSHFRHDGSGRPESGVSRRPISPDLAWKDSREEAHRGRVAAICARRSVNRWIARSSSASGGGTLRYI